MESGMGGVMIWEVGQDCRSEPVAHWDGSRHVVTCPGGTNSSLLRAIASEIDVGVEASHKESSTSLKKKKMASTQSNEF